MKAINSKKEIQCHLNLKSAILSQLRVSTEGKAMGMECEHLREYRERHGVRGYMAVWRMLQVNHPGRAFVPAPPSTCCATCGRTAGSRLYACLVCAAVACWRPPHSFHARSHARNFPGHHIALDLHRAELFCCFCKDQVYDKDFDALVLKKMGVLKSATGKRSSLKRARTVKYRQWTASAEENVLFLKRTSRLQSEFPLGLRGLNNLGNTCFINSVLQALLHTPPLRDYFLGDRHSHLTCEKKRPQAPSPCLACDTDTIFSAAYSGETKPFSPAQFLHSWWQHAANFASYEQQDAHEFFISMLDGIHANDQEDCNVKDGGECCIAHRVFSGVLRSDVTCTACGFTSTAYDPCVDVSLDLEPHLATKKQCSECVTYGANGQADESRSCNHSHGMSTLMGCLDRFTRPERLGSEQKLYCQHCQELQESVKQMSIRRLPLALCFHIKRFEHSSTKNTSKKVDRYLQFPFSLDMMPYMSSSVIRNRYGNRIMTSNEDGNGCSLPVEMCSEFEIFAVVTHTGKLDAGHYISYLRLCNQWYKCDDSKVTVVSEQVVRASQCYMIYYIQKTFRYKAKE